jgi:hypothetical protein
MGKDLWNPLMTRICSVVRNARGVSLLLIIFLMLAVSISVIGFLTLGVKLQEVKKERLTPERLDSVRKALQRYYLSHHDLPAPNTTDPANTVPVAALNLPQEFRFDSAGQFIHYDCVRPDTGNVDILGITVREKSVAAVLVAAGPDRMIAETNRGTPYDDPTAPSNDDIVVAVPVNAEAVKIATRALALLQAAAKAYDGQFDVLGYRAQFDNINNDQDARYPAYTYRYNNGTPDDPTDDYDIQCRRALVNIDEGNLEDINPSVYLYRGYVPAEGGDGVGCVRHGRLVNDPDRGTASLDGCTTAARDIVALFGLSERYIIDPWGNPYVWGRVRWVDTLNVLNNQYGGLEATLDVAQDRTRDRRYWSFYSMGPNKTPDDEDDITPATDRIDGYYATEPLP